MGLANEARRAVREGNFRLSGALAPDRELSAEFKGGGTVHTEIPWARRCYQKEARIIMSAWSAGHAGPDAILDLTCRDLRDQSILRLL